MNTRTTIFLLVILLVIGAVVLFTSSDSNKTSAPEAPSTSALIKLQDAEINHISLTNTLGEKIELDRHGDRWRLSAPVNAPAATPTIQSLISSLLTIRSQGQVKIEGNSAVLGLDNPSATVALSSKSGSPILLKVGAHTGTGGNAYVRLGDNSQADLVPVSLLNALERPSTDFRDSQLVETKSPDLKQIILTQEDGSTTELRKSADGWKIVQPFESRADEAAASDLGFAIAGLRAEEFVSEDAKDLAKYELDTPRLVLQFSDDAASTQPAASQPNRQNIKFGRYDDVLKKNIYALVGDNGPIVKVSAASIQTFEKKPLELRDRKLVDLKIDDVVRVTITTESASTTQPSPAPVVLVRDPVATTQSTQPAEPTWHLSDGSHADRQKVTTLLRQFTPFRVNRFVESLPVVAAQSAVVITLESADGTKHAIRIVEPAGTEAFSVQGSYNGLSFEAAKTVLDAAKVLFAAPPPASQPVATQPS